MSVGHQIDAVIANKGLTARFTCYLLKFALNVSAVVIFDYTNK